VRGWRETEREFRRERDRRIKPSLPKLKFMEGECSDDGEKATRFSECESSQPMKSNT
jgi:hypothetical protein